MHQPKTVVPGSRLFRDEDGNTVYEASNPLKPQNRRIKWDKVKPMGHQRHFKNAAARLSFEKGETPLEGATNEVPIYRGLSARVYKQVLSDQKYKAKLASDEWLKGLKARQKAAA